MPSGILSVALSTSGVISLLTGKRAELSVAFRNLGQGIRLYNLNIYMDLPDGVTLADSGIPYTSASTDGQGVTHYAFLNLTDLVSDAPPYVLSLTLACAKTRSDGSVIPFGYLFQGGRIWCRVDTMPRGNYDVGNQVLEGEAALNLRATRYQGFIRMPSKMLKGAGTSMAAQDYAHVYTGELQLVNNATLETELSVVLWLRNSCRYLGGVTAEGANAAALAQPQVSQTQREGESYTKLDFGKVTLTAGSDTTVRFSFALWNRADFNQGAYITHGTWQSMLLEVRYEEEISLFEGYYSIMELLLLNGIQTPITDAGEPLALDFTCMTGQYRELEEVWIGYTIPDGIHFLTATPPPDSVNAGEGMYRWHIPLARRNMVYSVPIAAQVRLAYVRLLAQNGAPMAVAAGDPFYFPARATGTVVGEGYLAADDADVYALIGTADIAKEYLGGYYADGAPKTIPALAPGDGADFRLVYDGTALRAVQRQVGLTDFFPLSADPVDNLSYQFSGVTPQSTTPAEPHGVAFYYGDLAGGQQCTVKYRVPIAHPGGSTQNNNLLKLKGTNSYGMNYAQRTQVPIPIGAPDLSLTKAVSGSHTEAVEVGEAYEYALTLGNRADAAATDAFDFVLTDRFPPRSTYTPGSVAIAGTGRCRPPMVGAEEISLYVEQLAPGQEMRLSYGVTLDAHLPPGQTLSAEATTTAPYSQSGAGGYRYADKTRSTTASLQSAPVGFEAEVQGEALRLGAALGYLLRVTIPKGTVAYDLHPQVLLPPGEQRYTGPAYLGGNAVVPLLEGNSVSLPLPGITDARGAEKSLVFRFDALISGGEKPIGAALAHQTALCTLAYRPDPQGELLTLGESRTVEVGYPDYRLELSARDLKSGEWLPDGALLTSAAPLLVRVTVTNGGPVPAVDGRLTLPLGNGFDYRDTASSLRCQVLYQVRERLLALQVPRLEPGLSAWAEVVLLPGGQATAGSDLQLQASAVVYYGEGAADHPYGGEVSPPFICRMAAGVALLPSAHDKISENVSYRASRPGQVIEIVNHLKNTGAGTDNYTLRIEAVGLAYTLHIGGAAVGDISPGTVYEDTPPALLGLSSGGAREIKLVTRVPLDSPLGRRYDFTVTATSHTPPYPSGSVLNIDPS